jgi:uncharacterized protein YyaL (SSP411 family)
MREARNALAEEQSPFLQHGAAQPVDWQPWGSTAFERARRENRPVLLDIGAIWCHWCHVMDRESYEDAETAQLINELFVPVKVDRDERPDVDARYQRAVQVLTGQGGWPLTAFLTPDGDVFYGGTYFPPADQHGRPSFRRVLREIARVWRDEPARAAEAARGVSERLREYAHTERVPGELTPALIDQTLEELAESFDFRHGGFGRAPKFANAAALDLLIDRWLDDGTEWARRMAVETLVAIAKGGIHDQLGGGFHRYSTDARWIVPHFEKMAHDNGVLQETFTRAHTVFGDPLFAETAAGVAAHYRDVSPELVARGGFPASQDADYGADDGDYWTWTESEIRAALADETAARIALLHFGLDDPASAMHLDPARHVLFRRLDSAEVASRMGLPAETVAQQLYEVRTRLKAARDERPRPFVDETLYTGWVALVASGHLCTARYLRDADALQSALSALDRIWAEAFDPVRGIAHRVGGTDTGEVLEDQAFVAKALLDAFETTQDAVHLERIRALLKPLLARFRDGESGAFRDRPADASDDVGPLSRPLLPIADAPVPSGNGMMALVLLRLAALTHEEPWRDIALETLHAFGSSAPRLGSAASTYVKAVAWATLPVTTVVVVRDQGSAGEALLDTALTTYRPRTVVRAFTPADVTPAVLPPELAAMVTLAAPRAYLCAGHTCAAPTHEPAELATLLRTFRGGA